jgi:hypothetical protein
VTFLYHAVPAEMVGKVLYPLHLLAEIAPVAYDRQRKKYTGREAVLEAPISSSGMRFNDTIHCAPIHPHHLYEVRRRLNLLPSTGGTHRGERLFFRIPVERIRAHASFWYPWITPWINGYPEEAVAAKPPLEEFEPFDPTRYRELTVLPQAHFAYLSQMKRKHRPPLMFVHIPHVLVAGPIDTDGLPTISWDQQPESQT